MVKDTYNDPYKDNEAKVLDLTARHNLKMVLATKPAAVNDVRMAAKEPQQSTTTDN